ncbi:MAG: signal peptidase II [bacterium]
MLFYIWALSIVLIDQFIKQTVHTLMSLGQTVPLIPGLLNLTYVRNTGAAFSIFVGFSSYLAFVGIIVTMIVLYIHYRVSDQRKIVHIALAFILGGSLGNLIDRLCRTYVVDYVDVSFWPVFNFADIMINIGVIIFVLFFFEEEVEEIKEEHQEREILEGLEHAADSD